jgi:hypothetical protein
MPEIFTYRGVIYDVEMGSKNMRHGGPFDRGMADSYYGRPLDPHYYVGDSITSEKRTALCDEELKAYYAGHAYNDGLGDFKDWG